MLDRPNLPSEPHVQRKRQKPPFSVIERVDFAKWPPDDDALPAGPPPGSMGGGGFADDGNFKRGRFSPIAILVGLAVVALGVVFLVVGLKSEGERMTVEQMGAQKKNIFVLPRKDQMPLWRKWAGYSEPSASSLQQEALIQLAWLEDPEGIPLAIKALSQPDHKVKGVAAQVLAYYGSPKADAGKTALLEALKLSDDSDRPQIVWALVELKEASAFKDAMVEYRKGYLAKVERLGGGSAFDPEVLAKLVSLD